MSNLYFALRLQPAIYGSLGRHDFASLSYPKNCISINTIMNASSEKIYVKNAFPIRLNDTKESTVIKPLLYMLMYQLVILKMATEVWVN